MSLSYAIIGTGAIGGYYGACLQQAGCEVHFLLRSDYAQVCNHGIQVESINGDFTVARVNAYRQAQAMPPVDVAIVSLKTTQNHLLKELLPAIKPDGAILSLQNGLGVEADIVQQLSAATNLEASNPKTISPKTISPETTNAEITGFRPTVLGGLCFICANKVGAGHIRHLDYGQVLLGAYDDHNQRCSPTPLMAAIAADFARAQIKISVTDDLPMARWRKLVWNVPYNGLSVVLDATTEEMMADDGVRSLITTLMNEVVTAANAWGENVSPSSDRTLPTEIIDQMLTQTEQMSPYRTSMKIDYDEGRSLEIETILGNPIRAAKALSIPTPAMTMLYQQLTFLQRKKASLNLV